MRFMKYVTLIIFFGATFFFIETAHANITRHCKACYRFYIDSPEAIRGNSFVSPEFSGRGGCGAVVPNRCRDRASEHLIACFRAQFSNPRSIPAECTEAHDVRNYPIRVSLESYIRNVVCNAHRGHREISVRAEGSISGDDHCDCHPWSEGAVSTFDWSVLSCPTSTILITCPQQPSRYQPTPQPQPEPEQTQPRTDLTVIIEAPAQGPTLPSSLPVNIRIRIPAGAADPYVLLDFDYRNTMAGAVTWEVNPPGVPAGYDVRANPGGIYHMFPTGQWRVRAKLRTPATAPWTDWRTFNVI